MCLCVQAEKKMEDNYKNQHTAVFRSATERLMLVAKVRSLFLLFLALFFHSPQQ